MHCVRRRGLKAAAPSGGLQCPALCEFDHRRILHS